MKSKTFFSCIIACAAIMFGETASANVQSTNSGIDKKSANDCPTLIVKMSLPSRQVNYLPNITGCPKTQTEYCYDYNGNLQVNLYTFNTYDEKGRLKGFLNKRPLYEDVFRLDSTEYEFNEDGMIIKSTQKTYDDETTTWNDEKYFVKTYDSVCKDIEQSASFFKWDQWSNSWTTDWYSPSFYKEIVRNEDGSIQFIQDWDDDTKQKKGNCYKFEYADASEGATAIYVMTPKTATDLVPSLYFDNITWNNTNKQYLTCNTKLNKYTILSYDKNNQPTSYNVYKCLENGDKGDLVATFTAEYDENNLLIRSLLINKEDNTTTENTLKYNENGKCIEDVNITWTDSNNNNIYDNDEKATINSKKTRNFDEYGNITLYEEFGIGYDGSYQQMSGAQYKYVYKEGNIAEIYYSTYSSYGDAGYINSTYTVYEDFDQASTGIKDVTNDSLEGVSVNENGIMINSECLSYSIYDVQGNMCEKGSDATFISTDNLARGIYIVKIRLDNKIVNVKVVKK